MNFYHILYNPYASGGKGEEKAKKLSDLLDRNYVSYYDMTKIEDLQGYINSLDKDEKIVICGGDGTLNRFINSVDTDKTENPSQRFL